MSQPISQEVLDAGRRKLCRRFGAGLVWAMAETDSSFELLGKRLGITEDKIATKICRLIRGESITFEDLSDLALAMGCEFRWRIERLPPEATGARAAPSELKEASVKVENHEV